MSMLMLSFDMSKICQMMKIPEYRAVQCQGVDHHHFVVMAATYTLHVTLLVQARDYTVVLVPREARDANRPC